MATKPKQNFWIKPNGPVTEVLVDAGKTHHGGNLSAQAALPYAIKYAKDCKDLAEHGNDRTLWKENLLKAEAILAQVNEAIRDERR